MEVLTDIGIRGIDTIDTFGIGGDGIKIRSGGYCPARESFAVYQMENRNVFYYSFFREFVNNNYWPKNLPKIYFPFFHYRHSLPML